MRLARSRWASLTVASLALATLTPSLHAQRSQDLTAFGAVQFVAGGAYMNVDALNARFAEALYPSISDDGISFGASAYGAWGNTLLGIEFGSVDFGQEGLNNGRVNQLKSSHLMATVGYAVLQRNRFQVYPFLGIGSGRVRVLAADLGSATVAPDSSVIGRDVLFDDAIGRAGRAGTWIDGGFLLFEPGVGADVILRRNPGDRLGIVLGVRAGTRIAPNNTSWRSGGFRVGSGPDVAPTGSYLRVSFGIGG